MNSSYNPKCVVVQCGADGLVGDPIGGLNLTPKALAKCVENIMKWEKPTLFLGGGNIYYILLKNVMPKFIVIVSLLLIYTE